MAALFGLGVCMVLDVYLMLILVSVFSDMLNNCVRNESALWPRYFMCFIFILSGYVELLFHDLCVVCLVCSIVISMGVLLRHLFSCQCFCYQPVFDV